MSLLRCRLVLAGLLLAVTEARNAVPIVPFGNGRSMMGMTVDVDGTRVNRFLGIRYAQPPVGELRFRKPRKPEPWSGMYDATAAGSACLQAVDANTTFGDEDCLFLDIDVPANVSSCAPKSVMLYVHGGSFLRGMGSIFIGAPLAAEGDVIVVTINYRLGVLGFLADENDGTGNYALWDQKAAIMWVKENIASFGGDPDSITIFGESAGAAGVVAQMMHQENEGLFQRVISESGTLYQPWGWYLSRAQRSTIATNLKNAVGCGGDVSVHECYRSMDAGQLVLATASLAESRVFHPVPDNDFFPADINEETYGLSQRFDLLVGYNKNEVQEIGALFVAQVLGIFGESVDNGISFRAAQALIGQDCQSSYTDEAVELCVGFLLNLYDLDTPDDKQRLVNLFNYMKHTLFDMDVTHLAWQHSASNKTAYAYQFSKFVGVPRDVLGVNLPDFIEQTSDHTGELFYVFGFDRYTDSLIDSLGPVYETVRLEPNFQYYVGVPQQYDTEEDATFSRKIQKLWANFAKTGSPNSPTQVEVSWPQFEMQSPAFMALDANMEVIDAPDLSVHRQVISALRPARIRNVEADVPVDATCQA